MRDTSDADTPFIPSEESQKLWLTYSAELDKRQLSGSENFDKSVLTLSSAGLALSISFLKDFVPIEAALWPWALFSSWTMFVLATGSTMVSFLASSRAQERQKAAAYRGYMLGIDSAFSEENPWNQVTKWLNRVSAVAFISALVLTSLFFGINLGEGHRMPTYSTKPLTGPYEQRGAPVPTMNRPAAPASAPASAPSAPAPAQKGS